MANINKKLKSNSKSKIRSNPSLISLKKPLLSINYSTDPLFATKCHPTEPVIISGSATGKVQSFRYDVEKLINSEQLIEISSNAKDNHRDDSDSVIVNWETKRHKGSCRDLCFDLPSSGNKLYSIGSEGVIKMADVKTGQVISKFIGEKENLNLKMTKCISVPNKEILIVGDEKGTIRCHDTRAKGLSLSYEPIKNLHGGESINSISHCYPKSDYKLITVGSTTVCEIDLRKTDKILHESEDQGDEILCSTWLDQETQDIMLCGMGEGVATVWKPKINEWEDQISRIKMCKMEAVESVISAMDNESKYVWGGCSNGVVGKVDVKAGKIVEQLIHNNDEEADEVAMLDLDYEYRLVSAGMDGLKIWTGDDENGRDDSDDEDREENDEGEEMDSDQLNDSDSERLLSSAEEELEGLEAGAEAGAGAEAESEAESEAEPEAGIKAEFEDEISESKEKSNHVDRKKLTRESLKRRFAGLMDPKDADTVTDTATETKIEIVNVEDSNEEAIAVKHTNTKEEEITELKDIRDRLLAQLDDSDDADEAELEEPKTKKPKKRTKKEKKMSAKQLKNAQTHVHGITKFEGL